MISETEIIKTEGSPSRLKITVAAFRLGLHNISHSAEINYLPGLPISQIGILSEAFSSAQ